MYIYIHIEREMNKLMNELAFCGHAPVEDNNIVEFEVLVGGLERRV